MLHNSTSSFITNLPPSLAFHLLKNPSLSLLLSLLAVCHSRALSTGVLWQKPAQQEYFSWRCHNPRTLWEQRQGLFSIIRSITNSHHRALHPVPPPPRHTHQVKQRAQRSAPLWQQRWGKQRWMERRCPYLTWQSRCTMRQNIQILLFLQQWTCET